MTPLLGFTPDIDPATPGAMPSVRNMVPTQRGMKSAPTGVTASSALDAACRGAAVLQKTSGERRTVAGTQTRLYDLGSSTWATASGTFVGSSSNRWSFAQFGDVALASNHTDPIQYATSTTFTAIPGAPKARIIVSVPNFVVALNTADATASVTYGTAPDRWWCCAFQDPTSWTVSVTTQAASGRLIGGGGEITAGAQFGNGLVVFKQREMFLGQYAGPPTVFDFQRIVGDQGCVGPEAVADIGGALFFVGDDNIWIYDGSRPRPMGEQLVRRWFFDSLSATYKKNCIVRYDASNSLVYVFFPFNTSTTGLPDRALVCHLPTQKWGLVTAPFLAVSQQVEAVLNFVTPAMTWDTLRATSWDSMGGQAWDSETWQQSGRVMALFNSSHVMHSFNGAPNANGFVSHAFGNEMDASSFNTVFARFLIEPASSVCQGLRRSSIGGPLLPGGNNVGTILNGKYCLRQAAKLHQLDFYFNDLAEIIGFDVPLKSAGKR